VLNRSRSVLPHRAVTDRSPQVPLSARPGTGQDGIALLEPYVVVAALRALAPQQREVLVLQYYGGLSEAQIASTMGISKGAVKSHTSRGMSSLRAVLEREA
jgi:DNA-directed RNA polymerase specialized sigma24 family protein